MTQPTPRTTRLLRLSAMSLLALTSMAASSADAATLTGSFPRGATPNAYARPDVACDRSTDAVRAFETYSFSAPRAGLYRLVISRMDGNTGLVVTAHRDGFDANAPCTGVAESKSTTGSVIVLELAADEGAFFDVVIAGNDAFDAAAFKIDVTGPAQPALQCPFSQLLQTTYEVSSAGGDFSADYVPTGVGCTGDWYTHQVPTWITGVPSRGTGPVAFTYSVAANPEATARETCVLVGIGFLCVSQQAGEGCNIALETTRAQLTAEGGEGTVEVAANHSACEWTPRSEAAWITATETTDGAVAYRVDRNLGQPRTGSITVSGQTFEVAQESGCTGALVESQGSASAEGGQGSFAITGGEGCEWSVSSRAEWLARIRIDGGNVLYTALPSDGAPRTGVITVASTTTGWSADYTITQGAGCLLMLERSLDTLGAAAAVGSFPVASGPGCTWTASSSDAWLSSVQSAEGGVSYAAASNTGAARTGTIQVVNPDTGDTASFLVAQASGCALTVDTAVRNTGASAGQLSVAWSAGEGCAVHATSEAAWLKDLQAGAAEVTVQVAANDGVERSAVLTLTTVDGASTASVTVNQQGLLSAPWIVRQPEPQVLEEGDTAVLAVEAVGGNLEYQWRYRGQPIAGATSNTLVIANASELDAGTYDVLVSNALGAVDSEDADLKIQGVENAGAAQSMGCATTGVTALPTFALALIGLLAVRRRR